MPIYHDGKKMKPYRGYRKPVNVYYGDKKVAGWKNSTQTGNNLTFQTTYNDTADVVVKGKTLQKNEWVHKQGLTTQQTWTGKNLFNPSQWETSTTTIGVTVTYLPNENCFLLNGTSTADTRIAAKYINLSIVKGSKFSISTKYISGAVIRPNGSETAVAYFGANDTIDSSVNWRDCILQNSDTVMENVVCDYNYVTRFWFHCSIGVSFDNYKIKIQLEQNQAVTSYEPYVGGISAPNPSYPQPLISNLPAGTYKTQDWNGDWWEFALTEDLCGIGDVSDAVEFDMYGHKGFESRKIGQILSYTDEIIVTAYMSTTGGLDTGAYILYVLANLTRTPLTFTLNNASTAPECPMEFLTDTPSGEYPAEVFDASGTVSVRGKNLFDPSMFETPRTNNGVTVQYLSNEDCLLINGVASSNSAVPTPRVYSNIPIMNGGRFTISTKYISGAVIRPNGSETAVAYFGANNNINASTNWQDCNLLNTNSSRANTVCNYNYITAFWIYSGAGVIYDNYKVKIQLEQNTVATPYEPYRPEVTAPIPTLRSIDY